MYHFHHQNTRRSCWYSYATIRSRHSMMYTRKVTVSLSPWFSPKFNCISNSCRKAYEKGSQMSYFQHQNARRSCWYSCATKRSRHSVMYTRRVTVSLSMLFTKISSYFKTIVKKRMKKVFKCHIFTIKMHTGVLGTVTPK